MGRGLGQLAGILAFVLALARLGRLLQSGPGLPQWHLILIASAFLGGVVWWLLGQLIASRRLVFAFYAIGAIALFLRIIVPDSLVAGVLPSLDTPGALMAELDTALRLIRRGIPPIVPNEGVLALLALLMWGVGALYSWALADGPVAAFMVPSIVLYLQFAIFDRSPGGLGWMAASAVTLGLALTAVAMERSAGSGRARDTEGRPMPKRSPALALVMAAFLGIAAVTTADGASGLVSEYGNVPWRGGGSGYGSGGGGVAFDRFVDLRQSLISRSNALLFRASLGPDAPPASQIYWRMETLDEFDGESWRRSPSGIRNYEPGRRIGSPDHEYLGTTADFLHLVRIESLRRDIVPTAGVATEIHQIDASGALSPRSFQWAEDAALYYSPGLAEGDTYQVRATYPLQNSDLGVLATGDDGRLSPIFARATADGLFTGSPEVVARDVAEPLDLDSYIRLPDNLPAAIRGIAAAKTQGAETDFEKAWMLQHWFRDSGDFTYSTEVTTGHDSLVLEDWLTDPTSVNYRIGYCEQFAASMGVLGRSLGIPSRVVWGFTPGSTNQRDEIEIRDVNAHAWVEMWMEGFGWVKFDPTPRGEFQPESITAGFDPRDYVSADQSSDPLQQPIDPLAGDAGIGGIVDDPPIEATPPGPRWWLLIVPALALLSAVVPVIKKVRRRQRLRRVRGGDITAAWDELVDQLTDLGEDVPAWKTPLEFAHDTDSALLSVAVNYSAAIYGGRSGQARESDLLDVESWMSARFDALARARAAMSPRSLMNRD